MRPLTPLARRLLGIMAVVVALLVGSTAVPADAGGRGGPQHPDQRCQRTLATGVQTIQVRFGGTSYPVRLVVPAGVSKRSALPLVLDLHGSSSNGVARLRSAT